VLVLVMGDSEITNVLLSLQKDVVDVLNENIYYVKQEEVVQRVEKEEGVRFYQRRKDRVNSKI